MSAKNVTWWGFRMAAYGRIGLSGRKLSWCEDRGAVVIAEPAAGMAGANKMCGSRGVTTDDPPVLGSDYFNVIMRVGRPMGRVARFRRAV